jgi:hypothetical protein
VVAAIARNSVVLTSVCWGFLVTVAQSLGVSVLGSPGERMNVAVLGSVQRLDTSRLQMIFIALNIMLRNFLVLEALLKGHTKHQPSRPPLPDVIKVIGNMMMMMMTTARCY